MLYQLFSHTCAVIANTFCLFSSTFISSTDTDHTVASEQFPAHSHLQSHTVSNLSVKLQSELVEFKQLFTFHPAYIYTTAEMFCIDSTL